MPAKIVLVEVVEDSLVFFEVLDCLRAEVGDLASFHLFEVDNVLEPQLFVGNLFPNRTVKRVWALGASIDEFKVPLPQRFDDVLHAKHTL